MSSRLDIEVLGLIALLLDGRRRAPWSMDAFRRERRDIQHMCESMDSVWYGAWPRRCVLVASTLTAALGNQGCGRLPQTAKKRQSFERVSVGWDLPAGVVEQWPGGAMVTGQLSVRTDAILPGLLHMHRPEVAHGVSFAASARMANSWLQTGKAGLGAVGDLGIEICIRLEGATHRFRVHDGAVLEVSDAFFAARPEVVALWHSVQSVQTVTVGPLCSATVADWVVFLWALGSWCQRRLDDDEWRWAKELRNELARVFAYGVDVWTTGKLQALPSASRPLAPLLTKQGRRRKDPLVLESALDRLRSIKGSSTTALAALCGDPKIDDIVTHILCVLYERKCKEHFEGVRRLQINWDPATYSGWQVNLGLCWSSENGMACILMPKA